MRIYRLPIWFSLTLIFFMVYPKKIFPSSVELQSNKEEPGFDLTDEEIRKFKIWPRGIVPYFIDDFSYDKTVSNDIRQTLDAVNSMANVKFVELSVPPENDERWVFFINRQAVLECQDYTTKSFTNEGVQKLVLGYDCPSAANAILALLGVPPQHNAPNRDQYIKVQMENIIPEKKYLFEVLKDNEWLFHDIAYDFESAGHYDFHKYTANGSATIIPKTSFLIKEESFMTYSDMAKIRMLYNYIARKRHTTKIAGCSKLFKPGNNFNSFKSKNDDKIKPRAKPSKYLGFKDDYDIDKGKPTGLNRQEKSLSESDEKLSEKESIEKNRVDESTPHTSREEKLDNSKLEKDKSINIKSDGEKQDISNKR